MAFGDLKKIENLVLLGFEHRTFGTFVKSDNEFTKDANI